MSSPDHGERRQKRHPENEAPVRSTPLNRVPQNPLLALQKQAGNKAVAAQVQRWYEARPGKVINTSFGPLKQPVPGAYWDEVPQEPRDTYFYKDATGQWWKAEKNAGKFEKCDGPPKLKSRSELEKEAAEGLGRKGKEKEPEPEPEVPELLVGPWYNVTYKRWETKPVPTNYRTPLPWELPDVRAHPLIGEFADHQIESIDRVPVFKVQKFRPRRQEQKKKSSARQSVPVELRTLDRTARVLAASAPTAETQSPHLAVAFLGDSIVVAGNTGKLAVSADQQARADKHLRNVLDGEPPRGRDERKMAALSTGDYQHMHPTARDALQRIYAALSQTPVWENVDAGPKDNKDAKSMHGELTILDIIEKQIGAKTAAPGSAPIPIYLGGTLLACGACDLAIALFNTNVAVPAGYQVVHSGTHGTFYPGWMLPGFILTYNLVSKLEQKLPQDWIIQKRDGRLIIFPTQDTKQKASGLNAYESDSDVEG